MSTDPTNPYARNPEPSPELVDQLLDHVAGSLYGHGLAVFRSPGPLARGVVDAILPLIASVDENAHNRGRAEHENEALLDTAEETGYSNGYGTGFRAACQQLAGAASSLGEVHFDDETPTGTVNSYASSDVVDAEIAPSPDEELTAALAVAFRSWLDEATAAVRSALR